MPVKGKVSPSEMADMMKAGRKKDEVFGKVALDYAMRLAMEREGISVDTEVSARALDWGNEWEPFALAEYEEVYMMKVWGSQISINHPNYKYIAGTPDGLVGEKGGVDVKCPYKSILHMKNRLYGHQIDDYFTQLQGYMWITGRQWWDLVSYDPRMPDDLRINRHRIKRDQEFIDKLEARYLEFEKWIQKYQSEIKEVRQ